MLLSSQKTGPTPAPSGEGRAVFTAPCSGRGEAASRASGPSGARGRVRRRGPGSVFWLANGLRRPRHAFPRFIACDTQAQWLSAARSLFTAYDRARSQRRPRGGFSPPSRNPGPPCSWTYCSRSGGTVKSLPRATASSPQRTSTTSYRKEREDRKGDPGVGSVKAVPGWTFGWPSC
jgi:hypothetical protein